MLIFHNNNVRRNLPRRKPKLLKKIPTDNSLLIFRTNLKKFCTRGGQMPSCTLVSDAQLIQKRLLLLKQRNAYLHSAKERVRIAAKPQLIIVCILPTASYYSKFTTQKLNKTLANKIIQQCLSIKSYLISSSGHQLLFKN